MPPDRPAGTQMGARGDQYPGKSTERSGQTEAGTSRDHEHGILEMATAGAKVDRDGRGDGQEQTFSRP